MYYRSSFVELFLGSRNVNNTNNVNNSLELEVRNNCRHKVLELKFFNQHSIYIFSTLDVRNCCK